MSLLLAEFSTLVALSIFVMLAVVATFVVVSLLVAAVFTVVTLVMLLAVLSVSTLLMVMVLLVALLALVAVAGVMIRVMLVTATFLVVFAVMRRRGDEIVLFLLALYNPTRTQGDGETHTQTDYKTSHGVPRTLQKALMVILFCIVFIPLPTFLAAIYKAVRFRVFRNIS